MGRWIHFQEKIVNVFWVLYSKEPFLFSCEKKIIARHKSQKESISLILYVYHLEWMQNIVDNKTKESELICFDVWK